MNNLKRTGYTGIGWATWKIGKKVLKRQAKKTGSRNAKVGLGLLIVAIIGAIIVGRSGE